MLRVRFIMEQHLGHQTYYQNLRRTVEREQGLSSSWAPITYVQPDGLWGRLPLLPERVRGTLTGRSQVLAAIRRSDDDVLFFNTQVPAVLGGGLTGRRPYVVATDITPLQYDQLSELYGHRPDRAGPLQQYKHQANVRTLRGAARLLPWSTWTRDSLIRDYGVAPERVTVIPPGVDLQAWRPGPKASGGPLRILFVGGEFLRKGGATLLEAFRALPAGAAELDIVTRSAVEAGPGVRVHAGMRPNSPELVALYRTADLFVLPTRAEAFGIAAVEATAAGLASIVSPVGGITDVVADGENGFHAPPGDAAALARLLRTLADDPELRARMGRAARARAEAQFDAERNAARVIACLRDAAALAREARHVAA